MKKKRFLNGNSWKIRFAISPLQPVNICGESLSLLLIFALPFLLSFFGCGYVSTSSYLKHIESITIPRVENETVEYQLTDPITESLRTQFQRRWTEGNDSTLTVTIKEFDIRPRRFDATNNPEQLRMYLRLDYTFEDKKKNKIIDSKQDYFQFHDYFIVQGRGEEPETRETALARLIQELGDDLYSNLVEQW